MSLSTWSRLGDDLKLDLQAVTNRDLKGQDWKTSNQRTAAAEALSLSALRWRRIRGYGSFLMGETD